MLFSKSKRTLPHEQKPFLNCQTVTISPTITFIQMCTDVSPIPSVQLKEGADKHNGATFRDHSIQQTVLLSKLDNMDSFQK